LAGYITHPNVAGAAVLSLGCQNAKVSILEAEIEKRDSNFAKPLYICFLFRIQERRISHFFLKV
jgi:altronate hydrolase